VWLPECTCGHTRPHLTDLPLPALLPTARTCPAVEVYEEVDTDCPATCASVGMVSIDSGSEGTALCMVTFNGRTFYVSGGG